VPRGIDGKRYYETTEICEKAGIDRLTLFCRLIQGILIKLHVLWPKDAVDYLQKNASICKNSMTSFESNSEKKI